MNANRCPRLPLLTLTLATLAALPAPPSARASILTAGNFQTGTPTPTLTISAPITLTINFAAPVAALALVSWVPSDGNISTVSPSPSTQSVSYLLDGVPGTLGLSGLVDNNVVNSGSSNIRANDGVLLIASAFNVRVGQTLTLLPQTFTFDSTPDFNPHLSAVFNGNVFLTEWHGGRISDVVSAGAVVPEPSTWALLVAGGLGVAVAAARRRARRGHGA